MDMSNKHHEEGFKSKIYLIGLLGVVAFVASATTGPITWERLYPIIWWSIAVAVVSIPLLNSLLFRRASADDVMEDETTVVSFPDDMCWLDELPDEVEELDKEELVDLIKRLSQVNRRLKKLSNEDELTRLYNRRYFHPQFEKEWLSNLRREENLSVLVIDIDHFKQVNDTYGHIAGDVCLKKTAAIIRETLKRPTDWAARLGGEEFIAVLPDTDAEGAWSVAEHLRRRIAATEIPFGGQTIRLTVSIGVSTVRPRFDRSAENLIFNADQALYQSKRDGRNRVSAFPEQPGPWNFAESGDTQETDSSK